MDAASLIVSAVLPWSAGIAALLALRERTRALDAPGEVAWLAGSGYLAGAFALTLWMRALSLAGIPFGAVATIEIGLAPIMRLIAKGEPDHLGVRVRLGNLAPGFVIAAAADVT